MGRPVADCGWCVKLGKPCPQCSARTVNCACGRVMVSSAVVCTRCRAKARKAEKREAARAACLCVVCCKEPADLPRVSCKSCAEASAKRNAGRMSGYRKRMLAGLCSRCDEPVWRPGAWLCRAHTDADNAARRMKDAVKRHAKKGLPKAASFRFKGCAVCGASSCAVHKATHAQIARYARSGWTVEAFDKAHAAQRGLCAICGYARELVADHCHKTLKTRKLLCHACNTRLGWVEARLAVILDYVGYYSGTVQC